MRTPGLREALAELACAIAEEIDAPASIVDVLDVLTQSLPYDDDRLALTRFPVVLRARSAAGTLLDPADSRASDLNDHAFILAGGLLTDLITVHVARQGTASVEDLAIDLLAALRDLPERLVDGAPDLHAIEVEGPHRRGRRPNPGDVIAIPSPRGGTHLVVMITKNRFGVAYGLLPPASAPLTVYSDDVAVLAGTWPIVRRDESVLARFPGEPEIFHFPGRAETAAGATRTMSDDEIARSGLLQGRYSQGWTSEHLAAYLDAKEQHLA